MGEPLTMFTAGDRPTDSQWNDNFKNSRDGLLELVANEAIDTTSGPKPFYVASNGWIGICDGNDQDKLEFVGFVKSGQNVAAGEFVKVYMGEGVIVKEFSGLTRGSKYYVQDDQTIGTTAGTYEIFVGYAISATEMLMAKGNFEYMGSGSLSVTGDSNQRVGTVTMPSRARIAILTLSWTLGGAADVIIMRKGKTSASSVGGTPGTGYISGSVSCSLSGNTITCTSNETANDNNAALSGSAYFYR